VADNEPKGVEQRAEERERRRRRNAERRRARRARERERRLQARRGDAGPTAEEAPQQARVERGRGRPRVRQGVVVSDKAPKTLTVRIDTRRQHRVYKKTVRESTTLNAHDERDEAREGDTVRVVESRPLSATKRWRLIEIVERAR
jgi:small subunit ribosomal protein S17